MENATDFDFHTTHPKRPEYMGFSEFIVNEHRFRAWQPGNSEAPREWLVEVELGRRHCQDRARADVPPESLRTGY